MTQVSDDEAGRQMALKAAVDAKLLLPCPQHPDVLVVVGELEAAHRPDLAAGLSQLLASFPAYCPQCADEGD